MNSMYTKESLNKMIETLKNELKLSNIFLVEECHKENLEIRKMIEKLERMRIK